MGNPADEWQLRLESTYEAARQYSRVELVALARRAVYRLQRLPTSGIFGDEYAFRTLWDEYCYEIQEGPHTLLDYAWDHVIESILDDVIARVPHHSAVLLSMVALSEEEQDAGSGLGIRSAGITEAIRRDLDRMAANRSLDRVLSTERVSS